MSDKQNPRSPLAEFIIEFGKIFARFVGEASKLVGKTTVRATKAAIEARRQARLENSNTTDTEDSAESTEPDQVEQTTRAETHYVSPLEDSDPEAVAMLEEILQQTAKSVPEEDEPATDEIDQETANIEAEKQTALEEKTIPSEQNNTPEPTPLKAEVEADRERIQAQLEEQEDMKAEELEKRSEVFLTKEVKQVELQNKIDEDMERIRQEREARRLAFEQAENERRKSKVQRQVQETDIHSRLVDVETSEIESANDVLENEENSSN